MERKIRRTVTSEMVNCLVVFDGQREVDEMLIAIPPYMTDAKRRKAIENQLSEAGAVYVGETGRFMRTSVLSMPLDVFVQMAEIESVKDGTREPDEVEEMEGSNETDTGC